MKKYDIILADPPWDYDNKQQNNPARGGITYPQLSLKEMKDIPIYKAAEDNSILICWVTMPKLVDSFYDNIGALDVIHSWGFRPVTTLFTWVKLNKNAKLLDGRYIDFYDLYSGLGRYTNSNAEIAIVARRGKGLPRINKNVKQLIFAPISKHSEKPKEQYYRIRNLYGMDVDKIELFARKDNAPPIPEYDATGYDWDGVDIREWIKQYE